MLKRRSNILTLFRFFVSAAIADFGADGSSKWTTETFSFRLKRLQGRACSAPSSSHLARYRAAVPNELVQYRDAAASSSIPDSNRSIPSKFRQKVTRYAPAPHLAGIGRIWTANDLGGGSQQTLPNSGLFFGQDLGASFPHPSELAILKADGRRVLIKY
jgi:hypothetical protein